MYRFRKDRISVLVVVDRRRRKNNGLYPVKVEVIYRRIQKYYPTGKDVSLEEWASMWRTKRLSEKCISIERSFHLVRSEVERLADKGNFCFSALDARLGRIVTTLNEALQKKMDRLLATGHINSYYRYRNTLRAVERYGGNHIDFNSVNVGWMNRCERFWAKEGKCATTINIYMKTLRCVMRDALDDGLMHEEQFPFKRNGYKIPASASRKLAMSKEDICKIKAWKGDEKTEYWRDMWLFSYLCNGINFRDMIFLKYGDVVDGEIRFARSKTINVLGRSKMICAPVTPIMEEILERIGNGLTGHQDHYLFKHATGNESPMEISMLTRKVIHKCNKALKKIADDLNLPPFSTYSARHSFATVLKRSGANISFISESLGHSSIAMTQNYLGRYDKDERLKYSEVLLD